jgi:hypothetical protein
MEQTLMPRIIGSHAAGNSPAEGDPSMTSSFARGAPLPTPLTSLVDRQDELAAILVLLPDAQVRLLTMTGPGGSGKTRLAIAAARQIAPDFRDDIGFVDLGPLVDPA